MYKILVFHSFTLRLSAHISFWALEERVKEKTTTNQRVLVSTVGSLLSSPVLSRLLQEVDGVRKEKERLTTDHQPQQPLAWLMV